MQTVPAANAPAHERDYKGVLIRKETKERLRALRAEMPADRNFYLERRMVTAAVEMMLDILEADKQSIHKLHGVVGNIVSREIASYASMTTDASNEASAAPI